MKIYSIIFCCALLSACARLNSDFDCSMKPGTLCKSLDDVNRMIDRGELNKKSAIHDENYTPKRSHETLMKIWMAPYEDSESNYHKASEIFTVTQKSHWKSS
jgi:conjugal transfer pilus assembly protein TraV